MNQKTGGELDELEPCSYDSFAVYIKLGISLSATKLALSAALPTGEERLAMLHGKTPEELAQMPTVEIVEISGLSARVSLTTYIDVLTQHQGDVQVAVQLVAHGRFGFSRVWAQGFRASSGNTKRKLTEEELWEYT